MTTLRSLLLIGCASLLGLHAQAKNTEALIHEVKTPSDSTKTQCTKVITFGIFTLKAVKKETPALPKVRLDDQDI